MENGIDIGTVIALQKTFGGSGGGSSGGGVLVVHNDDGTLDKTWQEIHDASFAVVKDGPTTDFVFYVDVEVMISGDNEYVVRTAGGSTAKTDSPDGYPVLVDE